MMQHMSSNREHASIDSRPAMALVTVAKSSAPAAVLSTPLLPPLSVMLSVSSMIFHPGQARL